MTVKSKQVIDTAMFQLNERIKTCPACKGWGHLDSSEGKVCKSCGGRGVYIEDKGRILAFNLPAFVDFGKRRKLRLLRRLLIIGLLIFGFGAFLVLIFFIFQIF